ncbi:MAG: alpha/beta hydrolase [Pseudomonadota bacterium]
MPLSPKRLLPRRLPPGLLSLVMRFTTKPRLARIMSPMPMRRGLDRAAAHLFRDPPDAVFDRVSLPGPAGAIPATWARTAAVAAPDGTAAILYLHGGAYLAGSARTHRHVAAALAAEAGMPALLPDYRLAPEHRLPAALADARAAWNWLLRQGYAPGSIAFAGDSAGGGLVFALLADLTADRVALPGAVVAFSPWVDMRGKATSLDANAEIDAMLPAGRLDDVVRFCLGEDGDRTDWRVSPVLARYDRPPPAMIFASMDEILLDDAIAMEERLRRAGSDPVLELRQRLPHAWVIFRGYLKAADEAIARAGRFIAAACQGR